MSGDLELTDGLRIAVHRVKAASVSGPGSERFREQLRTELANQGVPNDPQTLDAVMAAIASGRLGR